MDYTRRPTFPLPTAKPTSPIDFVARLLKRTDATGGGVVGDHSTLEALTQARRTFTDGLLTCRGAIGERPTMMAVFRDYVSRLQSIPDGTTEYNWVNVIGEVRQTKSMKTSFEVRSAVVGLAHWHVAYGVRILEKPLADSDCIDEEEKEESENRTKDAYHSFLQAAGMFEWVYEQVSGGSAGNGNDGEKDKEKEAESDDLGRDLSPPVLEAFQNLALCYAEEITIGRAVHKGHRNSLIAKLCVDVFERYSNIFSLLAPYDFPPMTDGKVKKLRYFLRIKLAMFEAQCLLFQARHLWQDESHEYGKAMAGMAKANKLLTDAIPLVNYWAKAETKSSADDVKRMLWPVETLGKYIEKWQTRLKRENDFIFFARATDELPELPAGQSLFAREPFSLPQ